MDKPETARLGESPARSPLPDSVLKKTMTIRVDGKPYGNFDDPLAAGACDIALELGFWGVDLSPRWEDTRREMILLDIPMHGSEH